MDFLSGHEFQAEQKMVLEDPNDSIASQISNIGRLIEDLEFKMRHSLQEIYFGKTKDIVNDLRSVQSLGEREKLAEVQRELAQKLQEKSK